MKRFNFLLALAALMFGNACVNATDWKVVGGGEWTTGNNWSSGNYPNGNTSDADFSLVNPASESTVTITDTPITLGFMVVGSTGSSNTWTLNGSSITLNNNNNDPSITVNSGSKLIFGTTTLVTPAGKTILLSGGGTLQVANASGVTGWNISNATLLNSTNLGSGTITLAGGAVLSSNDGTRREISNNIIFSGDNTLYSKGLSLTGTLSGSGIIHKQGGWDMTISGNNTGLSADWYLEADYARFKSAAAIGTGGIYYKGGALLAGANNLTFSNALHIDTDVANYLVGTNGGSNYTVTLTGAITGSKNINLTSNQYQGASVMNLQGDASAFTGNWTINENYENNKFVLTKVSTNNSSNVKINGGDSRFGSGKITLGRGVIQAAADKTYIHNAITLQSNAEASPFSFEGKVLTLTGGLSGSTDITLRYETAASSTANRLRLLDGDNSGFTGDWHVKNVLLVTNAGNSKGKAFGTGTLYLEGGAGIVGWSSSSSASAYNTNRADAYVYNNIVNSGVNFFRSDGDTIDGSTTNPNFQITVMGNISGDGLLVRQGGGYKFSPCGNNSQYTGDWMIRSDYAETNNTASTAGNDPATHTDARFGSGTIYLTDNAGLQGNTGAAVYCDITVNSGQIGNFRNGNPHFYGTVTADGTFVSANTVNLYGTVQGRGTVAAATIVKSGGVVAPGIEDVFQYSANYEKSEVNSQPIGTIKFSKGLTMESGSVFDIDFESSTSFDKISLAGSSSMDLSLDGVTINWNIANPLTSSQIKFGDEFIFLLDANVTSADGASLIYDVSKLESAYEGARLTLAFEDSTVKVRASDTAYVPEPSSWALLFIGLGAAGLYRLRRRKDVTSNRER